jgi:hypothetical protein
VLVVAAALPVADRVLTPVVGTAAGADRSAVPDVVGGTDGVGVAAVVVVVAGGDEPDELWAGGISVDALQI